jgi:aspartate racemase
MKNIGILGGLGPEATADYYNLTIKKFKDIDPTASLNYPEIVIYSVNMSKFINLLECKNFKEAANYLATCINKLEAAGADVAAISANTPHMLFSEIQGQVRIPLISIVESVCEEAVRLNLKKLLLLGTKFTMNNSFYAEVFRDKEIEIIVPDAADIDFINQKLFTELEVGIFKASTREDLLEVVRKVQNTHNIDGVILGCTEFPLLFLEERYLNLPFLNSSSIHVNKIVETCLNL